MKGIAVRGVWLMQEKRNRDLQFGTPGYKFLITLSPITPIPNYLINQLNNFQEEESILQYTLMLKNLKRSYDDIQIFYKKGDVVVDTIQKTISANEYQIETSQAAITEIALKIESIRTRLVQ